VEEVVSLLKEGVPESTSAMGSHGYRRVCEYLRGERTLENALKQTQQDVRNYAKRQISWFKRENNAIWLNGFGGEEIIFAELLDVIAKTINIIDT
jgi:tRNA dimethylallyltransferase